MLSRGFGWIIVAGSLAVEVLEDDDRVVFLVEEAFLPNFRPMKNPISSPMMSAASIILSQGLGVPALSLLEDTLCQLES